MLPPAILLIVLGLLIGPGYQAYCERWSGRQVDSVTLSERADRWLMPDGSIQRFRSGLAYRPVAITLHQDMGRVRFTLTFDFPPQGEPGEMEYLATLLIIDHPIFEQPVHVPMTGETTVPVRTFDVESPGTYLFLLEEVGTPRQPATQVTLGMRVELEKLYQPLMWFGYAVLLVGLALLAYALARGGRRGSALR